MPPKRKITAKAPGTATEAGKEDAPVSPTRTGSVNIQPSVTPLLDRLNRRSSEGKKLDIDMTSKASVEHGVSPAWKKTRAEVHIAPNPLEATVEAMRTEIESLRSNLESERLARESAESEVVRATANLPKGKKSAAAATTVEKRLHDLESKLTKSEQTRKEMEKQIEKLAAEKEELEDKYDDALNSSLTAFKSPGNPRKSMGRLSLSGYADEVGNGMDNGVMDMLHRKVGELEHVVDRQAVEIERLLRKGSVEDEYNMEGLDEELKKVHAQLQTEREESTKIQLERSKLKSELDMLTSERNILAARMQRYQENELSYEATAAELENVQGELLSVKSEVETYKKRCFNAEQSVDQLAKQLETSKNQIFALEERVKSAERDLQQANHTSAAQEQITERKVNFLTTEMNGAKMENRRLLKEVGEEKSLNHTLRTANIELTTSLQYVNIRVAELETKFAEAEAESRRARNEAEVVKQETAAQLRNAEIREHEILSTLGDNQTELGLLSTELRNSKQERDHLVKELRSVTDQMHQMRMNHGDMVEEMTKKHESELVGWRQKFNEVEGMLTGVRREKNHFESQLKAISKTQTTEIQQANNRIKELEQALDAQKKMNARLQRETSASGAVGVSEHPVSITSLAGVKPIAVLGSPMMEDEKPPARKLQVHMSQPVVQASVSPRPSTGHVLQRHITAPVVEQHLAPHQPAVHNVPSQPPVHHVPSPTKQDIAVTVSVARLSSPGVPANPLAFWKAKIGAAAATAAPAAAPASTTPRAAHVAVPVAAPVAAAVPASTTPRGRTTPRGNHAPPASTTPRVQINPVPASNPKPHQNSAVKSALKQAAAPTSPGKETLGLAAEPKSPERRLSLVEEVRKELMEVEVSPIKSTHNNHHSEPMDIVLPEKENKSDAYMQKWNSALEGKPESWKKALSRVTGGSGLDTFKFGPKTVTCRIIGGDMVVVELGSKAQTVVHHFVEKVGPTLDKQEDDIVPPPTKKTGAVGGGLRLKTLRKPPLGHANDAEHH